MAKQVSSSDPGFIGPPDPYARTHRMQIPPISHSRLPNFAQDVVSGTKELIEQGANAVNKIKSGVATIQRSIKSR